MAKTKGDSVVWGFLAVLLSIVGVVLVLLAKKNDKYAVFYAKQSLVIFIASVIAGLVGMIPFIGWVLMPVFVLIVFLIWIITLIRSLTGNMKQAPLIGKYANKFNF